MLRGVGFTAAQVDVFLFATESWTYRGLDEPIEVPGFPFSRPSDWARWFTGVNPPPWSTSASGPAGHYVSDSSFRAVFGADVNYLDLDLSDPAVHKALQDGTTDGATGGAFDFREFRDSGGKLLTYFGVDDPAIPYELARTTRDGALAYERNAQQLSAWYRSFLVPGALHCGQGAGPNDVPARLLNAMVAWVERGKAPDKLRRRGRRTGERSCCVLTPARGAARTQVRRERCLRLALLASLTPTQFWSCWPSRVTPGRPAALSRCSPTPVGGCWMAEVPTRAEACRRHARRRPVRQSSGASR